MAVGDDNRITFENLSEYDELIKQYIEDHGGGGGGGGITYSTTEFDTGDKWTDGRSIYCKVITGTFASTVQKITTDGFYDIVLDVKGFCTDYAGNKSVVNSGYTNNGYIVGVYVNEADHDVYASIGSMASYEIALFYVKITS